MNEFTIHRLHVFGPQCERWGQCLVDTITAIISICYFSMIFVSLFPRFEMDFTQILLFNNELYLQSLFVHRNQLVLFECLRAMCVSLCNSERAFNTIYNSNS